MSKETNEELLAAEERTEASAPPKKRAAKKATARKTAVKRASKAAATDASGDGAPPETAAAEAEAPARKTAARKTAAKSPRKTARKSAAPAEEAQTELPLQAAAATEAPDPSPAEPAAPPAKRRPKVIQPAAEEESSQAEDDDAGSRQRFGRVPGGGPVQSRETPAAEVRERRGAGAGESRPPQGQQSAAHEPRESRSKRRREKRKRRRDQARQEGGEVHAAPAREGREGRDAREGAEPERRGAAPSGPKVEVEGMLELGPKGFGFLRLQERNFEQVRDDVFVSPEIIRRHNLRLGQWIRGFHQAGPRGCQLVEISAVNGMPAAEAAKLPHFDELKAINPAKRISFESTSERFTTRVIDLMAPVGRGQRGLIVSPPRSGKTTLLLHMAEAIQEKYEETIHLMIVLVDERPEEVTEFRRALPGAEIYASSNDEGARSHCRIAELAIERAKRLVEAGKDVFLLMDSITRLARAYNSTMRSHGRGTGSGGITIGALEVPRRLFAAARNTRGGGSLTILATALIQTNSRADEAIFMEFKGTGNMELVLDRKIAEHYIYPAVDIFKSGTRREELLLPDHMLHKIHLIRRGLSGHRPAEAMERLLFFLKKFPNNPQMLLEIKG